MPILADRFSKGDKDKLPVSAHLPAGIDPLRAAAMLDLSQMLLDSKGF